MAPTSHHIELQCWRRPVPQKVEDIWISRFVLAVTPRVWIVPFLGSGFRVAISVKRPVWRPIVCMIELDDRKDDSWRNQVAVWIADHSGYNGIYPVPFQQKINSL